MLLPRFVRFKDAPYYLGMDRNRFSAEVRTYLTEVPIGVQGIAFDRLEMDAWAEQYKRCNGRPGRKKGILTWDEKKPLGSTCVTGSGTSINCTEEFEFAKALVKVKSQKRKTS